MGIGPVLPVLGAEGGEGRGGARPPLKAVPVRQEDLAGDLTKWLATRAS